MDEKNLKLEENKSDKMLILVARLVFVGFFGFLFTAPFYFIGALFTEIINDNFHIISMYSLKIYSVIYILMCFILFASVSKKD